MPYFRTTLAATLAMLALTLAPGTAAAGAPRQAMLQQINAVRAQAGVHPLRLSTSLNRSAFRFAYYLMRRDRFGHASRIRASRRFSMLGEVLERHRGHRPRIGRTLRAWLRSPAHRAVLLSRRFYWLGLGRVAGRFRGRRATIWVGHLGRR